MTSARNFLLEIMMNARNNQFKKNGLMQEIQQGLQIKGISTDDIDETQIQKIIDSICILKTNKNYALKWQL